MNKQPFLFYFIFLALGIFLGDKFPCNNSTFLYILFSLLLITLIFLWKSTKLRNIYTLILLLLFGLIGYITTIKTSEIPKNHFSKQLPIPQKSIIKIKVIEINNSDIKNKRYIANVEEIYNYKRWIPVDGNLMILLSKENFTKQLWLGDEYILAGKMRDITIALNPHQFNYQKFLARNQVYQNFEVQKILKQKKHSSLLYYIKNSNQRLALRINNSSLKNNSKEFLKAFLLGDRTEMNRENIKAYSKAGIMHLIAISGMHVAFIFGIIFYIVSKFPLKRKTIILVSLGFVWLFGLFVGLAPSVFRACLMISIFYITELLHKPSNIYQSMSVAAVIILLFNPFQLFNVGFQLSFAAVFFIIWLNEPIFSKIKSKNKKINDWILNPLAMTLAAQLGTLPLVMYYFHQFSLLSIFANIFVIFYTPVVVFSSIFEIFIVFLPEKFQFFNIFYDVIIWILISLSTKISQWNYFIYKYIDLSVIGLISLISLLIFLKFLLKKTSLKNWSIALALFSFFQIDRSVHEYINSKKQEFIIFNRYKHSLIGIRSGKNLCVYTEDSDNKESIEDYIIYPYATAENIDNIIYKPIVKGSSVFVWKNQKIYLHCSKAPPLEKASYLIISHYVPKDIKEKRYGKIIFDGSIPSYKLAKNMGNSVWITSKSGAYILRKQ